MIHTSECGCGLDEMRLKNLCRRERKPATKFEGTYSSFTNKGQDFAVTKGDGTALTNIPPIAARINAADPQEAALRLLHSAIHGSDGDSASRKQHLLSFQGLKGESSCSNDNVRSPFYFRSRSTE